MTAMYLKGHATWGQAMTAGSGDWIKGGLLVAAALLYWRVAKARPWLAVLSMAGMVYGVYGFLSMRGMVQSWNVFSGDLVVVGAMSFVLLIVIGVLAVLDFAVNRRTTRR